MNKTKNGRRTRIFASLTPCERFGDVGCDHGYLTQAMLESGKTQTAVCTDISAPSLQKAERLLSPFAGRVTFAVCDGISSVHAGCDEILIAGMGGMEIVHILQTAVTLPKRLVLQPMKDSEAVRRALDGLGYRLTEDTLFGDGGKYYYLTVGEKSSEKNGYTEEEFRYGRDTLREGSPLFTGLLRTRICEIDRALQKAKDGTALKKEREEIAERLEKYGISENR